MVIHRHIEQFLIALLGGGTLNMALPASEIQRDRGSNRIPSSAGLANLERTNRHNMRANVPPVSLRICPGTYNRVRHVTLNAVDAKCDVLRIFLKLGLPEVTIFTGGATRGLVRLAQLHDTRMGVVAQNAIEDVVFTQEHATVLVLMADEAGFKIHGLVPATYVAMGARLCIAVDHHRNSWRIAGMQTARSMTSFALHSRLSPGSGDARQTILVTPSAVSGCMADAAIIR